MEKLSIGLQDAIKTKTFSSGSTKGLEIILSDSNVAGEGEHKFLPVIRKMAEKTNSKQDTICIFSPDADMIVLSMATHKSNIWILRKPGDTDIEINQYINAGHEYLYLSIDEYRSAFIEQIEIKGKDPIRIINDYIFLTFLGGNDFVMPIPYLEIKKTREGNKAGGLNILLNTYKKHLNGDYLITFDKNEPKINVEFFKAIMLDIAKSEDYYMRGIQMQMDRIKTGVRNKRKLEREKGKTPYELELSRYEHEEYYSPVHPEYEKYQEVFAKFDFKKPKYEWKQMYYEHFFDLSMENQKEYNEYRTNICINYLEALVFTLKYYMVGVPSWSWLYRFRAPPIVSDILTNLKRNVKDMNKLKFKLEKPYKPYEQLMMILPVQMGDLLPKCYRELMKNELLAYYPIDFELEVVLGGKYIYSEPVLPYLDDKMVLEYTKKCEKKLTKNEKERNKLVENPLEY